MILRALGCHILPAHRLPRPDRRPKDKIKEHRQQNSVIFKKQVNCLNVLTRLINLVLWSVFVSWKSIELLVLSAGLRHVIICGLQVQGELMGGGGSTWAQISPQTIRASSTNALCYVNIGPWSDYRMHPMPLMSYITETVTVINQWISCACLQCNYSGYQGKGWLFFNDHKWYEARMNLGDNMGVPSDMIEDRPSCV